MRIYVRLVGYETPFEMIGLGPLQAADDAREQLIRSAHGKLCPGAPPLAGTTSRARRGLPQSRACSLRSHAALLRPVTSPRHPPRLRQHNLLAASQKDDGGLADCGKGFSRSQFLSDVGATCVNCRAPGIYAYSMN